VQSDGFANGYTKASHFRKHGAEFSPTFNSGDEYEAAALAFLGCAILKSMVECTRQNGDLIRYDKVANIMAVCSSDGTLRTFFRPNKVIHRMKNVLVYFRSTCKE
jgi:filamentous hemagglutinin